MADLDHIAEALEHLEYAHGDEPMANIDAGVEALTHVTLAQAEELRGIRHELRTIALLMGNQLLPDAHDAHLVGKKAMERLGFPRSGAGRNAMRTTNTEGSIDREAKYHSKHGLDEQDLRAVYAAIFRPTSGGLGLIGTPE